MASLPDLDANVFFGDAERPLPEWRDADEGDDEREEPTEHERAGLVAVLGFDPSDSASVTADGEDDE